MSQSDTASKCQRLISVLSSELYVPPFLKLTTSKPAYLVVIRPCSCGTSYVVRIVSGKVVIHMCCMHLK